MSDDERNSEHGEGDGEGEDGIVIGNDDGAPGGLLGEGNEGKLGFATAGTAAEVVEGEQVRRWGVVLVNEDGLEGEFG